MREKKCQNCGKYFVIKCGGKEFEKRKYCSKKCSNIANAKLYPQKRGKEHHSWGKRPANYKGGSVTFSGSRNIKYRCIYVDGKQVKEHVYLMEKILGRKLRKDECTHHIDGNGLNNNLSNLVVMKRSAHLRLHGKKNNKHKDFICACGRKNYYAKNLCWSCYKKLKYKEKKLC